VTFNPEIGASAFIIEELTGESRRVELNGRGLPFRPFTLKGVQRSETTWYPGNPRATQSIFGSGLEPTTVSGRWTTKFLVDTDSTPPITVNYTVVTSAREASEVLDSIRAQGQTVRVEWDGLVRRGILKEWEQSWFTSHDVEWTAKFEWSDSGDDEAGAVLSHETSGGEVSLAIGAALKELDDSIDASDLNLGSFNPAGALNQVLNAISDIGDVVESILFVAANTANDSPFDQGRRLVALLTSVVDLAGFASMLDLQPPRFFFTNGDDFGFGDYMKALAWQRNTVRNARRLQRLAALHRQVVLRTVQTQLLAVHTATAGEDLRDVSRTYYKTPFEWRRLLHFNSLESSELDAGQMILVPPRTSAGPENA